MRAQATLYRKAEPDPKLGADIFRQRCTACHDWKERRVGPAYATVVPKYLGRPAELAAFVRNPVKVDPAFPPMPSPGLNEMEIESIVAYLLGELERAAAEAKP